MTEEAIRLRLRKGELQGRRVRVGRRDRWFIDASEVARWRDRRVVLGAPVPARDGGVHQEVLAPPDLVPAERELTVDVTDRPEHGELERLRLEVRVLRAAVRELLYPVDSSRPD